ncbi:hypothetical protein CY34DRAFT_120738 [Suillus luteus UH-Slu-Lm8-n1]|uniref:Uncharacterized protein n=1 Tax=Suillus luteus UH-Slu-Lm8-n1 TaxID=930992 RepID=A0A0D0BVN3_9AGAM|nr:hypothetical protein CY34DRAFT_120738 [Suillus luteus UH-Slu-Lm8-n1]
MMGSFHAIFSFYYSPLSRCVSFHVPHVLSPVQQVLRTIPRILPTVSTTHTLSNGKFVVCLIGAVVSQLSSAQPSLFPSRDRVNYGDFLRKHLSLLIIISVFKYNCHLLCHGL